ncbi:hypothetical protein NQ317_000115 [Molorchus minor]|uniref:Carboxylesterase type B domain-containing protein n=1 Tax=Molorchus minor TaxID=1323400 RepID=A0ABQ9JT15_9CUCU|nr:hypothetical protein NQ317_000115 [Molorchus minor]
MCMSLADDPIISLPYGQIRGVATTTLRNNVPFYAYLGIPFAAPPVGSLRFQYRVGPPWTLCTSATHLGMLLTKFAKKSWGIALHFARLALSI